MTTPLLQHGATGMAALVLALVVTPLVIRWAHRRGWIAQPRADRWHERPTALMGGVAIYAATTGALLLTTGTLPPYLWGGATLLFVVGAVDDRRGLSPLVKLFVQVAAALLVFPAGYAFGQGAPWLVGPLTVLWVVGVTNAVNLLDNMDGLAAGVVVVAALAVAGLVGAAAPAAAPVLALAGGALGFLWYNFSPARVFMGDSGSLFLGYVLAAHVLAVPAQLESSSVLWLVPVAVVAVPIFDTLLVTTNRLRAGRPVSQGGRDHSSHRLVRRGLSERWAVASLYGLGAAAGGTALLYPWAGATAFAGAACLLVVLLAGLGQWLSRTPVYATTPEQAA